LGSNLIVQVKGDRVMRVLPLENESINECWISDRDRFAYEGLNSADRLTKPMLKQGGQWIETDWQTALEYVANGLKSIAGEHGANSIAAVATANSTTEELFLLNKLTQALGAGNAAYASRQADARFATAQKGATWLGQSLVELANSKAVLVVGSTLRKEHPLLAQRLRQSAKRGLQVSIIHAADDELYTAAVGKVIVRPDQLVEALAAVVKAVAEAKGTGVPAEVAAAQVDDAARKIAKSLVDATAPAGEGQAQGRVSVLLGNVAAHHPRAAELAALAGQLNNLVGATVGWMSESANTTGAQVLGLKGSDLLEAPRKAVLLLNVEVERDSANTQAALATVNSADMVVALSAYKHGASDYADVLLPITPFTETAGSFINLEGKLQAFNGVVKPLGDARPAWKVLRVLGNLLGQSGFDFDSVDAVRKVALPQGEAGITATLDNGIDGISVELKSAATGTIRLGEVTLYQSDAIVRRAPSLQRTKDAQAAACIGMSVAQAAMLGVVSGDDVKVSQGDSSVVLPAAIDDALPDDVVRVAAHHGLAGLFAPVQLSRA
jgi:NADH-quinone oxidoreductase subunit G